ncbi:RHS repeat-associated core domain-containing protein [Actinoallomurus acaciae]|uniref:RHS repeat-associated core domain-containing protein n=1 Tax=Actinoallomurus acaciae TaxID=502577 RepID=A0ABV5YD98_9ACTN
MTKDPIDVARGEVVLRQVDVELAGVLPLVLERTHVSSFRAGSSFGASWASTLDQRLELDAEGACFAAADGMVLVYPLVPASGAPVLPSAGPPWPLTRHGDGGYAITDPKNGTVLRFTPDAGRTVLALSAIIDRNGNRIDLDYAGTTLVQIRHSAGYRIEVETDGGRVTALRPASGDGATALPTFARYGYDDDGRLTEVYDSAERPLRFDYDDDGRLTGWTDRNGHWYRYEYDEYGRGVRGRGPNGFLDAALTYADRLTTVTDSLGRRTRYHLNELGQVVTEVDPLGHVTRSEWDHHDRLLSRTDPLGHTTRYAYDDAGNLCGITRPDGREVAAVHDARGLPVEITDVDGTVWRQRYDDRGNLVAVTDPTGAATRYTYDERGGLSAITDPLGSVTHIANDTAGLPISITDPLGGTTRCVRDPYGRIVTVVDPVGGVARFDWTIEGRLVSRVLPDGSAERWAYDAEGNPVEHVDASGNVSRTEYGPFDVPIAWTAPGGARTEFGYDTELRPRTVTGPQGLTWHYAYDEAGNLVRETDFNGRVVGYRYDAAGRLTSRINGAGQTVRYTRDRLGDVIEQRAGDALTTFAYDPAGRLVRAVNADADLRFERDPAGRVVAEVCDGRRLTWDHDALGRRVRRLTPSGASSDWRYDAAGRPAVLHTAGRSVRFDHDPAGREVRRKFDAGATLLQTWEPSGRLRLQELWGGTSGESPRTASGRLLQHRAYSYRPGGGVTGVTDRTTGRRRLDLDADGRVTGVHAAEWTERYAYDESGRPTDASWPEDDEALGGRTYTGTLLRSAGGIRYEYDGQGRVVLQQRRRLSGKPLTWRYEWDADDRLRTVTTPGGQRWRYRYDALGRRIAKQRLGPDGHTVVEQTGFTWDDVVLAEQTHVVSPEATACVTTWDYNPDGFRPLIQREHAAQPREGGGERWYGMVTDLTGSPTEMVTAIGELAWTHTPTLWGLGRPRGWDGVSCPLRFPGQYHDDETGFHYNHQRYYDPRTGRYQSPDPLGLAPQPDPHAYVLDPMTWADPLGLAPYSERLREIAFKIGRWKDPLWYVGTKLAQRDSRSLVRILGGAAPEPNATVADLLKLRAGNPAFGTKVENAQSRSDTDLLRSVFQPQDGQYMSVQPVYPDAILEGNHRRRELLERARDPDSEIGWDTPVFILNFKAD